VIENIVIHLPVTPMGMLHSKLWNIFMLIRNQRKV